MALDDLGKAALANPAMTVVNINNLEIGHRAVRCCRVFSKREKHLPELK